jgi:anti-sigma factor ChrR (cupin superfamily)
MTQAIPARELSPRDWRTLDWRLFRDGVEAAWLYQNGAHGPAAAYLRYRAGARVPLHWHPGYEHVFVLEGSQRDANGRYAAGSLLISPPGSSHEIVSEEGCVVLVIWERPVILGSRP